MAEALADEIVDAYNNTGAVVKKKKKCTGWLGPTVPSHICAGKRRGPAAFLPPPVLFQSYRFYVSRRYSIP